MKRFYYPLLLILVLSFAGFQAIANRVTVKGHLKFANGTAVIHHSVTVATDTLANVSCRIIHQVYTDSNGFYTDILECSFNIVKLRISTENCNGTILIQDPQVPSSAVVEANFTLCDPVIPPTVPIVSPPTTCVSQFTFERAPNSLVVNFNSTASKGSSATDNIIRRRWKFDNGDTLGGNVISPTRTYPQHGNYQVCLTILTAAGCEKTECKSISIADTIPAPVLHCFARFTYNPLAITSNTAALSIKFNSSTSETSAGDAIRERIWSFGDGTSLTGNVTDPTHTYTHDGLYTVCLTVKTTGGCQTQECKQVVVTKNSSQCAPQFTYERIAPKKVRFNSSMSFSADHDSIVERKWTFGDGSVLSGNVAGPVKEYPSPGIYSACLKIRTVSGCENTFCNTVKLQDSTASPSTNEAISILSLSPNPATTQIQTVVWSLHNNINASLAIYDIYGVKKWEVNKMLLQGNNVTVLPTNFLLAGPYFFKVTTMYGIKSRQFYKF